MRKVFLNVLLIALLIGGVIIPNITTKAAKEGDYEYKVLEDDTVEITRYVGNDGVLDIPSTIDGKLVTSIGKNAFQNCDSLTTVTIPSSVISIGDYAFYHCSGLITVTIPDSVTSIGTFAFHLCSELTAITIPGSIKKINDYTFDYCLSLQTVVISNGVESIGKDAFCGCRELMTITIPNSVTSIGNSAFWDCSGLTAVTIPNSVTSIGESAFSECSGLTTITIPGGIPKIEARTFSRCSSLQAVVISNGVESIEDKAFEGCNSLTSITIPNSVKSIGKYVFSECFSLRTIFIPDSVISIEDFVFNRCNVDIYYNSNARARTYAIQYGFFYSNGDIAKCKVTVPTSIHDNKEQTPTVIVEDKTKILTEGIDYTVKYENNIGIGTGTAIITGKGNYRGTITKGFTIEKGDYYNSTIHGGEWNGTNYVLDGVKMTNIFFSDGTYTYYLQADGTPMKNRLTYHPDGEHLIYFDENGHELFDQFKYCVDVGYTCYFDTFGYMFKDQIPFYNGKPYYLDGTGRMKQGEYFKFDNGVDIGYAQEDGSLINTGFGYDPWGRVVFYHWNGMIARGLITDGTWYYHMDETDGHLLGQFPVN